MESKRLVLRVPWLRNLHHTDRTQRAAAGGPLALVQRPESRRRQRVRPSCSQGTQGRGLDMPVDPHPFLSVATELAQRAAAEILKLLKNPTVQGRKADNSIVTDADLKADEIIRNGLAEAFPDHAILTEET